MSRVAARVPTVALVGNPNSGKTSLFNALTGAAQHVGNYPGVTVERVTGTVSLGGRPATFVDVPGIYSMRPSSADEQIAVDSLAGTAGPTPDVVVAVVDATSLERSLVLVSRLLESGVPAVVALTHTDVLEREGGEIDPGALAAELGCEVVPVVAFMRKGLAPLLDAVARALDSPGAPSVDVGYPQSVQVATASLVERFALAGIDLSNVEARHMLLDDRPRQLEGFTEERPELAAAVLAERERLLGGAGSPRMLDAQSRYAWAARVRAKALTKPPARAFRLSDRIDRVLTHKATGLAAFAGIMLLVFQSIYTLAGPLTAGIEAGIAWAQGLVAPPLAGMPVFQSLVVDGLLGGVGAALVFVPQIAILFLWIAVLEGTGYYARAAFLMDRLFGWCGLSGRAFIPLMSSFACAVPGILSARVMPDHRSRLATILVAPLMSCSARLPVYVLMVSAVVAPAYGPVWAGVTLFGMHGVGLLAAIPVAAWLNRKVLKSKGVPFVLEMPRYQLPKFRDVWLTVLSRVKSFLVTAGSIIVAMSVVIWALTQFPRSPEADARYAVEFASSSSAAGESDYIAQRRAADSYLGRFGRFLEPVFVPAGYDWRLTTAVLAAFPAREVVVSAMGILFGTGEGDEGSQALTERLQRATWPDGRPLLTLPTALSLMVFFALCCQCMATLATIRRETGSWKWPAFAFTYMTLLAYVAAVAIYQAGRWLGWA
jgi:ferrous iron transport protein B